MLLSALHYQKPANSSVSSSVNPDRTLILPSIFDIRYAEFMQQQQQELARYNNAELGAQLVPPPPDTPPPADHGTYAILS